MFCQIQEGCVTKVHDRVASNASILIGVGIGNQKLFSKKVQTW